MDGSKAWQLTNMPDTGISAIIEPYFNPKGTEVMWAQMTANVAINGKQEFGYWVIKIAPFIDDTVHGPYIDTAHARTIEPGGTPAFNEPYGWSPDGTHILFASDYNQFWVWDDQIYQSDTNGNNIEQMTSTAHSYPYTEHGFYSTDGKHIVWMTDLDAKTGSSKGGDDWFIMNSDTTDQERLTYFNDTTSAYWTGTVHVNCHGSYAPDNKRFIGDVGGSEPVQVNFDSSLGALYIINTESVTGITPVSTDRLQCSLYPNPNNGTFELRIANYELPMNCTVEIYNVLGEVVYSKRSVANPTIRINIPEIKNGIYLIKIRTLNSVMTTKFIVEGH
jgi:Secretion system C-terminal sorting domain